MRVRGLGALVRVVSMLSMGAAVVASPACSVLVDASAEQCQTDGDCAAKGAAFASTVCGAQKTCVFSCTTNAACIERAGGAPAICHADTGACAPLLSPDCPSVLMTPGDLEKDALVLGLLLPQTGVDASSTIPQVNAVELARREIQKVATGVPGARTEAPPRPLVFVSCTDDDDPVRAARHLAEVVRVPAIIGPGFSGVTTTVATEVTIPAGVLTISPSATSPTLTDLADRGLVWRTAPPDTYQAVAMSRLVQQYVEPEIRDDHGLVASDKIRLAVVHKGDAYGLGLANALFKSLSFNGVGPAANGERYMQIDYGDPQKLNAGELESRIAGTVDQILAFKPNVLITIGTTEAITGVFAQVEARWPASEPIRPRHVVSDGMQAPEMLTVIGSNDALRRRVRGTIAGTSGGSFDLFRNAYAREFTDGSTPDSYAAAAYDAAYLLAFAAAGAGDRPLTGVALDEQLRRTAPRTGRPKVVVGPDQVNLGFAEMRKDGIDFDGASGPLDFDVEKGEAAADIQIWCVHAKSGAAAGFTPTGAFFDARSGLLEGTPTCP